MLQKPVVVTGADGFLGKHLCKILLQQGISVIKASRKTGYDVCLLKTMEQLPEFDTLVHLAAQTFVPDSYSNTASFFQTNILGTLNSLEMCKKYNARFIFASSYVYGTPQYLPVDEKHPVSLWNPYATSKIIGEQLCSSYNKEFNISASVLRIFNIYGPGQNPAFLIPKIIHGIMNGKLQLESDSPKRDFVYVTDVAEAILKCIDTKTEGINTYNIGLGKSYSVKEVVELAQQLLQKKAEISYSNIKRANEVPDVRAECGKIKTELNWNPRFDLKEGLIDIIKELNN